MVDLFLVFNSLRRPKLLISAARLGLDTYKRDSDLRRVTGGGRLPGPGRALGLLLNREHACEAARHDRQTSYSSQHHVEILTALMAEAAFVTRANLPKQV